MGRRQLKKLISKNEPVLEIGPLDKPFLERPDYDVYYSDIQSTDEIKSFYAHDADVKQERIVPIDYVVSDTYRESIPNQKFQTVFSSHMIEHTADIISHLLEISEILREGGYYLMFIPDKRFTFDYFRDTTGFRDAYDIYRNGIIGLERLKLDCVFNYDKCNIPNEYLAGNVLPDGHGFSLQQIIKIAKSDKNSYEDFHYWVFTYMSFLKFLVDLLRFGILPYTLELSCPPYFGGNEFCIALKKNTGVALDSSDAKNQISKISKTLAQLGKNKDLLEFVSRFDDIYIYAATTTADIIIKRLGLASCKCKGLLISPEFEKPQFDLPVYNPNEIAQIPAPGIIIGMTETSTIVVDELLKNTGFENVHIAKVDE